MAINKIVLNTENGEQVLVDLTGDNVTPETTFAGIKGHSADGNIFTGSFTIRSELDEQSDIISQLAEALEVSIGENDAVVRSVGIPDEYQEVAYIESTGTQYIDAGLIPNQDTRVVAEHLYTKQPQNRGFIYGAGVSATDSAFELYTWTGAWNTPYGNTNIQMTPPTPSSLISGKIKTDKSKNNITITYPDGYVQTKNCSYLTFAAPRNMWLFAINRGNTAADLRSDCVRLYYCKIWDDSMLVRDFIPCYRKSDTKPGMYDLVSETFFTNIGTGEFLYGAPITVSAGYNAEIQANNDDLRVILDAANDIPEPVIEELTVTENGTYTASNGVSGYSPVVVAVPSKEPNLQTKTVSPTTSSQSVSPDSGYDGLSKVTVNAMPTATQATPSITVSTGGLITASATQSAGYVSAGTKSGTKQLTTQAATTITPTKSAQTAVASGVYTTGAVTVAAIPSQYITTTDATAVAADIRTGKTGYVNGAKITGSIQDFDGSYECSGDSTGGSGGGNLNTCTIHVSATSPSQEGGGYIAVTQWVDGNIVPSVYGWYPNTSSTIENVVCGSVITAREIVDCIGGAYLSDNMTFLEYDGVGVFDPNIFMAIIAPTEPDVVGEIRFS